MPEQFPDRDPHVFFELARDRLATQLSFADAVDAKIASVFSVASALLGALAAVFALRSEPLGCSGLALLSASGVAYLFIAERSIRALWKRRWAVGPKLEQVWADSFGASDRAVAWRAAVSLHHDVAENEPALAGKVGTLRVVLVSLAVQTAALTAALSLVAFQA